MPEPNPYFLGAYRDVARAEGETDHQCQERDGWLHCECGEVFAPVGTTADEMYQQHCEDRAIEILGIELALEGGGAPDRPGFLARMVR